MMFAKQMKEIEDDVPPVGFVDDGTDFLREQEQLKDAEQWIQYQNGSIEEW